MTVQLIRYGVVGVLSNLAGYLVYIGVTWLGVGPKTAVSILYPVAVFVAYFGHARYTFADTERSSDGVFRYVVSHVFGYVTNLAALFVLHDLLGFPHELVQLFTIFLVSGFLFFLFKYYVFAEQ
ncbi:GtrA family protein [uncultured Thiodictyon sp.]|uniref:GtrA family protein n=1 Tax=uncultured Thiodictyon sp. TaxID=1846217 RepID=UPI0025CBC52C|nr:GtrA family protein [uncultured Thiodictyon sp.]